MTHPFDALALGDASLLLTPCPGTRGVALLSSLQQLQQAGAVGVLTLMPTHELQALQVAALGETCQQLGLRWWHAPIDDDAAPAHDFAAVWPAIAAEVQQLLDQGQSIAVHCKGGSGRTGLACALLLDARGDADAKAKVQALRPYALTNAAHQAYFAGVRQTR